MRLIYPTKERRLFVILRRIQGILSICIFPFLRFVSPSPHSPFFHSKIDLAAKAGVEKKIAIHV
jgi:hypothetical protein